MKTEGPGAIPGLFLACHRAARPVQDAPASLVAHLSLRRVRFRVKVPPMMRRTKALTCVLGLGLLTLAGCASEEAPSASAGLHGAALPDGQVQGPAAKSGSPFGLYLAGEAAIDGGASSRAARYFAEASELEPDAAGVRLRAFTTALIAGDIPRAAEAAKALSGGDGPIQHLARLTRAVEAMAQDRGPEAYAILTTEPPGLEHNQAARLLRPWAAAAAGDWKAATTQLGQLGDPVMQGVAEMSRAELLERSGHAADAEAVLKARASGRDPLFVLGYGGFLERQGRKSEAAALYDRAMKEQPGDRSFKRARLRLDAGRPPAALASFKEGAAEALIAPAAGLIARHEGDSGLAYLRLALRLDPTLDEAWVLVGDAMNGSGDTEAALAAYRRVRTGSSEYVPARSRLALLAQQAGDKEGALRLARETLEGSDNDTRALVIYADLLRDDGRFAEAAQVLGRAIGGVSETEAGWALFYERGVALERAGDWPAAEADLQHALRLKPDQPEVLNYLGYAWADRGQRLTEALAMLEKASSLEPKSGAIRDSLGWARYRIRHYQDAMQDLERAVELAPSDPEVNSHLGDVYWRVGRRLEARFQWQRVLTLEADPHTRAAAEFKLAQGLVETTEAAPAP